MIGSCLGWTGNRGACASPLVEKICDREVATDAEVSRFVYPVSADARPGLPGISVPQSRVFDSPMPGECRESTNGPARRRTVVEWGYLPDLILAVHGVSGLG